MLARQQAVDDLLRMKRRGRDQENRLHVGLRKHRMVIAMQIRNAKRIARPRQLLVDGAARGDEIDVRNALREIFRVAAPEPPQADDADAQAR